MKLPVLFVGHGSPMNAIGDNAFTMKFVGYILLIQFFTNDRQKTRDLGEDEGFVARLDDFS